MQDSAPQLDINGPLATLRLRRPSVANRLEIADIATLREQINEVNARPEVRVLRLCAEGRHFCAGFNIGAVPGLDAGSLFETLADALEDARPITVAMVHGGIYGGATDLALACDFRLGARGTEMFVPAARLGLHFYRGGLQRYVSRLGLNMAKRVLLAGETLNAQEMLACGFLDQLSDNADSLADATDTLCQQLLAMAPLALLGMKRHLNAIARGPLDAQDAQALSDDIARCVASEDLAEGVAAWAAKRPAKFVGR